MRTNTTSKSKSFDGLASGSRMSAGVPADAEVVTRAARLPGPTSSTGKMPVPLASEVPVIQGVALLPLAQLFPSPTNPRKDFAPEALQELSESIKVHGVLQPLLARVRKGTHGRDARATTYEIVCGERRWRAAKLAGLKEVPALVRPLDDRQVVEMQVIENLQRADLNAMEEAQGYDVLIHKHGVKAEELAARIGKSRSHIFCRLKLLALCPKGREALFQGKIKAEVGLLIARIPDVKLQEKALYEVSGDRWNDEPMSFRKAAAWIKSECMLKLSGAPWPLKDGDLVPAAGACVACPKRTGNQKEVFSDVGSADVCTDPGCYARKKEAWTARTLAESSKKGQPVLAPEQAKKIFWDSGGLRTEDYIDLQDRCDLLGHAHDKHWQQTLGKACPTPTLAVDPQGNVHKLLRREEARAALQAAGMKPKQENGGGNDWMAKERARAKRKKEMRAAALAAAPLILEKLGPALVDRHHAAHRRLWELLARSAHDQSGIERDAFMARRRGLAKVQYEARAALDKWFKDSLSSVDAAVYVLEDLLVSKWSSHDDKFRPEFKELCDMAGVDLAKQPPRSGKKEGG